MQVSYKTFSCKKLYNKYYYRIEMPQCCAVPMCSKKTSGHRFPKDKTRLKQWLEAIRRDSFVPTNNSIVCKDHFIIDDYELPKESYLEKPRLMLKKLAVPSKFHWNKATYDIHNKRKEWRCLDSGSRKKETVDKTNPKNDTENNICDFEMEIDKITIPKNINIEQNHITIPNSKWDYEDTIEKQEIKKQKIEDDEDTRSADLNEENFGTNGYDEDEIWQLVETASSIEISEKPAHLCWCCLKYRETIKLTSSYTSDCGQSLLYNEMLQYCFGITLSWESINASPLICIECVSSLVNAYIFKQQVISAVTSLNVHCSLETPENQETWIENPEKSASEMSSNELSKLEARKEKYRFKMQLEKYKLAEQKRKNSTETKKIRTMLHNLGKASKMNAIIEESILETLKEYSGFDFNEKSEPVTEIQNDNENIISIEHSYSKVLRKSDFEIFEITRKGLDSIISNAISLGAKDLDAPDFYTTSTDKEKKQIMNKTKNVYTQTIIKRNRKNKTGVKKKNKKIKEKKTTKRKKNTIKEVKYTQRKMSARIAENRRKKLQSLQETTESYYEPTESFQDPTESFQEPTESFQESIGSLQVSLQYLQKSSDVESFNENGNLSEMNGWKGVKIKTEQIGSDSNEYNNVNEIDFEENELMGFVKDEFIGVDVKDEFECYRTSVEDDDF